MTSDRKDDDYPLIGVDWGAGQYERIAQVLHPAAQVLVDAAQLGGHEAVLDVGSGTGSVALLAAATGSSVVAVDLSTRLLAVAQDAAKQQGLHIACRRGQAADLPVPDSTIDCMLSNFGLIFAENPEAAVAEVSRVLRPGGRALMSAWLPGGAGGALATATRRLVDEALGANPGSGVFPWHDMVAVQELFGRHRLNARICARGRLTLAANSPEAYLDAELADHPVMIAAFDVLRRHGMERVTRERLLQVLREENEDLVQFRSTARYHVVSATHADLPPDGVPYT